MRGHVPPGADMLSDEHRKFLIDAGANLRPGSGAAPAPVEGPPAGARAVISGWIEAKTLIKTRQGALRQALLGSDDPEYVAIGHAYAFDAGSKEASAIDGALAQWARSDPATREGAIKSVRSSAGELVRTLEQDRLVAMIDDNPLGIDVDMKARYRAAISRIIAAL